jgi:hypothetical protein
LRRQAEALSAQDIKPVEIAEVGFTVRGSQRKAALDCSGDSLPDTGAMEVLSQSLGIFGQLQVVMLVDVCACDTLIPDQRLRVVASYLNVGSTYLLRKFEN